jgi:hypothetical protein
MASLGILFAAVVVILGLVALAVRWPDWPDTRDEQGARPNGRSIGVAVTVFAGLAVLAGLAYWVYWALWGNLPSRGPAPPPDRWVNVMTGVGAAVAATGILTGGVIAWLYGRKASVSITAKVHRTADGVILATRPLIKAVGIFRVRFQGPHGASVQVRELHLDDNALAGLRLGDQWEQAAVFGEQHADGGEQLPTTVIFRIRNPAPTVVGWVVWVTVQAPTRWVPNASESWADRIFVSTEEG